MSGDAPAVTVITATYNWSSVLRYAIKSVLAQDLQDFEMLVVGDGCTDDSGEVVGSFRDPRIRWHNLERNSGSQSIPNNRGLELARGRYVAYLGHDDLWYPTHLSRLVAALQSSSADFAHSLALMIGPPETGIRVVTGIYLAGGWERDMHVPPSSLMHRRDVWRDIGGWKDYRLLPEPPDAEFQTRALRLGKRFVCVPELTAFKFNSAWRRNCYREKPCHEQAECFRRIMAEPDFIQRELVATVSDRGVRTCHRRSGRTPRRERPDGGVFGYRLQDATGAPVERPPRAASGARA